MSDDIDPRTVLLTDIAQNDQVLHNIRRSVISLLQQHGEFAASPDTVDFLTNLTIHFMSDLSTQAATIHRLSNSPYIHREYIRHIVRTNPQMVEILNQRFPAAAAASASNPAGLSQRDKLDQPRDSE